MTIKNLLPSCLLVGALSIAVPLVSLTSNASAASSTDRIGTSTYCSKGSPVVDVVRSSYLVRIVSYTKKNNINYSYTDANGKPKSYTVGKGVTLKFDPAISNIDNFHYYSTNSDGVTVTKINLYPCDYDRAIERGEVKNNQGEAVARVALYDISEQSEYDVATRTVVRSISNKTLVGSIGKRYCMCGDYVEIQPGGLYEVRGAEGLVSNISLDYEMNPSTLPAYNYFPVHF